MAVPIRLTTGQVYLVSWPGTVTGTSLTLTGRLLTGDGTAAAPAIAQGSDADNGIYFGTNQVLFATAGTARWQFSASGHLLATTDNTYTIGAVGATRPSIGYFGTSLFVSPASLGVTSTDGLVLQNLTAATVGAQQMPPRLRLDGFGWKTDATAASQAVSFINELLPVQGTEEPTANLLWKYAVNGGAYVTKATLTSGGGWTVTGSVTSTGGGATIASGSAFEWASRGSIKAASDGVFTWTNGAETGFTRLNLGPATSSFPALKNSSAILQVRLADDSAYAVLDSGRIQSGGLTTVGTYGVPNIVAQARATAQTAVNASVATYTVGAADGTFEVSANCLVTTSTTHSFSLDVTYTDEGNTARTLILPVAQLAGAFVTGGLITNATGAGPYESTVLHIRAKAATAITIRTSAGGTYTTVTYNVDGTIKQIA